jgi:hypothetical protein
MSDWQPGDLALCVSRHESWPDYVQVGRVYIVEHVWHDSLNLLTGDLGTCLDLIGCERFGDNSAYGAFRFIKVSGHTPDAEDAETIRLLTGKPVPEPAQ